MIIKQKRIMQFIFISLLLTGCATTENNDKEQPDILDIYGSCKNGEYINNYYGFKLNIRNRI